MARLVVKRKIVVFAALVLCASAHGQTSTSNSTQTPTNSENTLESARRELKDLPATERTRDILGKSSTLGSAGLPLLPLPGDTANTAARPDPNKAPSANWLQDALNQADSEAAAHRRATDPSLARDRDRPGGYKPVEVPNPFGQYLEQWISPRDLELLRAGQETKKPSEPSQAFVKPWEPPQSQNAGSGRTSDVTGGLLPDAGQTLIPIMPVTTRNPYIEEPDPTVPAPGPNAFLPQNVPGQPQTDRARVPAPLSTLPSATAQGSRPTTPLKPAVTPAQPTNRPPTAPIVDDRKYFPQLRRF